MMTNSVTEAIDGLTAFHAVSSGVLLDPWTVGMVVVCMMATSLVLSGLRVMR